MKRATVKPRRPRTLPPQFLGSELGAMTPASAQFHVLPVPYEKTVSYGGGTAKGPAAIIAASNQLERWDGASDPGAEGLYTWPAVDCRGQPAKVIASIAAAVANILRQGKMPVVLGGEHTVTWGVMQGYFAAGMRDFGVVQIDAHADLRDRYEGDPLSHACVMRRIVEAGIPLYQLGIRTYCEEERIARERFNVRYRDAAQLVPGSIDSIKLPKDFPARVFFTLDVDGIDPSVLPATGTPVPGGLGWYQTLGLFESVAKQRRIIGFDLQEFAPIKGFHAYDFAAATLVYKMMGIVQRHR
ncbi:MAG: agmatinase [Betaproteobacteria bacterium]|nr:agmatinase [Betaproteobacteria bacterium]